MTVRFSLFATAALVSAAPAAAQPAQAWRTDVPCTTGRNPAVTQADTPRDARVAGCARSRCIALPDGRRVCTCTADSGGTIRVEQGGRTVHTWPADYSLTGTPESLRVMRGDLDGDGRAELIVSEWMDMSNGLGIRYYRLSVVDGAHPERAPLQVNVDDFTPGGSFVRPAGGGECRLLATAWRELRDPRRGEGMYFTGQWMRYRGGRLEHDLQRPVVVRRLLNSFDREARGAPLASFTDRRAEAWNGVPAILPPLAQTRRGTILRVREDTVDVALTPHETAFFRYVGASDHDDAGNAVINLLVDGATGRSWPRGYLPHPDWLQLAPVTIRTYRQEGRIVNMLVVGTPSPSTGTR
jgi:hypothetical protein